MSLSVPISVLESACSVTLQSAPLKLEKTPSSPPNLEPSQHESTVYSGVVAVWERDPSAWLEDMCLLMASWGPKALSLPLLQSESVVPDHSVGEDSNSVIERQRLLYNWLRSVLRIRTLRQADSSLPPAESWHKELSDRLRDAPEPSTGPTMPLAELLMEDFRTAEGIAPFLAFFRGQHPPPGRIWVCMHSQDDRIDSTKQNDDEHSNVDPVDLVTVLELAEAPHWATSCPKPIGKHEVAGDPIYHTYGQAGASFVQLEGFARVYGIRYGDFRVLDDAPMLDPTDWLRGFELKRSDWSRWMRPPSFSVSIRYPGGVVVPVDMQPDHPHYCLVPNYVAIEGSSAEECYDSFLEDLALFLYNLYNPNVPGRAQYAQKKYTTSEIDRVLPGADAARLDSAQHDEAYVAVTIDALREALPRAVVAEHYNYIKQQATAAVETGCAVFLQNISSYNLGDASKLKILKVFPPRVLSKYCTDEPLQFYPKRRKPTIEVVLAGKYMKTTASATSSDFPQATATVNNKRRNTRVTDVNRKLPSRSGAIRQFLCGNCTKAAQLASALWKPSIGLLSEGCTLLDPVLRAILSEGSSSAATAASPYPCHVDFPHWIHAVINLIVQVETPGSDLPLPSGCGEFLRVLIGAPPPPLSQFIGSVSRRAEDRMRKRSLELPMDTSNADVIDWIAASLFSAAVATSRAAHLLSWYKSCSSSQTSVDVVCFIGRAVLQAADLPTARAPPFVKRARLDPDSTFAVVAELPEEEVLRQLRQLAVGKSLTAVLTPFSPESSQYTRSHSTTSAAIAIVWLVACDLAGLSIPPSTLFAAVSELLRVPGIGASAMSTLLLCLVRRVPDSVWKASSESLAMRGSVANDLVAEILNSDRPVADYIALVRVLVCVLPLDLYPPQELPEHEKNVVPPSWITRMGSLLNDSYATLDVDAAGTSPRSPGSDIRALSTALCPEQTLSPITILLASLIIQLPEDCVPLVLVAVADSGVSAVAIASAIQSTAETSTFSREERAVLLVRILAASESDANSAVLAIGAATVLVDLCQLMVEQAVLSTSDVPNLAASTLLRTPAADALTNAFKLISPSVVDTAELVAVSLSSPAVADACAVVRDIAALLSVVRLLTSLENCEFASADGIMEEASRYHQLRVEMLSLLALRPAPADGRPSPTQFSFLGTVAPFLSSDEVDLETVLLRIVVVAFIKAAVARFEVRVEDGVTPFVWRAWCRVVFVPV